MSLCGRDSWDLAKACVRTDSNDNSISFDSPSSPGWLETATGVLDAQAAHSTSSSEASADRSQWNITERSQKLSAAAVHRGDKQENRTGNTMTATAHIITTVIGSGILSLSWAISTMGWVAGPTALTLFAAVTWFTSVLLADAARHPRDTGPRNCTYPEAVRVILGGKYVVFCAVVQNVKLVVIGVGYTITAAISMVAVRRANCLASHPSQAAAAASAGTTTCQVSNNSFMLIFGAFQIFLSQIRNLNELWLVSVVAAAVSFIYSSIAFGLAVGKTSEKGHMTGSIAGRTDAPASKTWAVLAGLGSIAFAYEFSVVLVEIQDTIKAEPSELCRNPETKQMKRAISGAVLVTTAFYMTVGCLGYSAFGDVAPVNVLIVGGSQHGFVNPSWLVDTANVLVMINMLGGYQVMAQPWFAFVENAVYKKFGKTYFTHEEFVLCIRGRNWLRLTLFRLTWRTIYVCLTTVTAMILPFFVDVVALIGAMGFWPLTVFLPIEMHIRQTGLPRWTPRWIGLQVISILCLLVSLAAGVGAVAKIINDCKDFAPFQTKYTAD